MQKRLIASLLDVSFTSLAAMRLVRIVYVLTLIASAVVYVGVAIVLFNLTTTEVTLAADGTLETSSRGGTRAGLLWLFPIGPLVLFCSTVVTRLGLELATALFRIHDQVRGRLPGDGRRGG